MKLLDKFRWYLNQMLCGGCIPQEGVVEEINSLLPPSKRIRSLNVLWDFNYVFKMGKSDRRINLNPEIDMLDCDSTPSIFLGGVLHEGYGGRAYFKSYLKGYLEKKGDIKKSYFDEYFGL